MSTCSLGDGSRGGDVFPPAPLGGALGAEITVSGPVAMVVDAHVFEIGTDGGDPVLVVALTGAGPLIIGTEVEVTGAVETFDLAVIQQRTRAPLNPALHRLDGRPAVVARTVKARARMR